MRFRSVLSCTVPFLLLAMFLTGCPLRTVSVPDLRGLSQTAAEAALSNVGLNLGAVSQAHSDTVAIDLIISQLPGVGALVSPGSSVSITVSLGPDTAGEGEGEGEVEGGPSASFLSLNVAGQVPFTAQFFDTSLPGDGVISSWAWEFGDGGTSSEANPTHTYTAAGTFDVRLTVTNALGQNTTTRVGLVQAQALSDARFVESAPFDGEGDIAVTRETVLKFSAPLNPDSVTEASVYAKRGSQIQGIRRHLSSDGREVTLFYSAPLPGSTTIEVTINGDLLTTVDGRLVDADDDGAPGGSRTIAFTTLGLTTVPGTAVYGRVFASELAVGAKGTEVNMPLEGVEIMVDGRFEMTAVTDAEGNFRLDPAPSGRFFVHIRGLDVATAFVDGAPVATSFPAGPYYPTVGKAWEANPGVETNIGDIYLPLIQPGALKDVSATEPTEIGFVDDVIEANPDFAGVHIIVPPDSLYNDSGERGGQVGIAPVAPNRLPSPLPEGLNLPLVITVQTNGPNNFDTPVPACFPNLPDPETGETLPPGSPSALWSFNHDSGEWEIVGPMTVSEDGTTVCTDPGIGIIQPGWHGTSPGTEGEGPQTPERPSPENPGEQPRPLPRPGDPPQEPPMDCEEEEWQLPDAFDVQALTGCAAQLVDAQASLSTVMQTISLVQSIKAQTTQVISEVANGTQNDANTLLLLQSILAAKDPVIAEINAVLTEIQGENSPLTQAASAVTCAQSALELIQPYCNALLDSECAPADARAVCFQIEVIAETMQNTATALAQAQTALADFSLDDLCLDVEIAINALSAEKAELSDEELTRLLEAILSHTTALDGITPQQAHSLGDALPALSSALGGYGRAFLYAKGWTPNAYVRLSVNGNTFRKRASQQGVYDFILPPNAAFVLSVFDPLTMTCGDYVGVSAPSGQETGLEAPVLAPCGPADGDSDGLPDAAEVIVGTDSTDSDSDNDGTLDGAEVQQGSNPLDGFIAENGIIASTDMPGDAGDVDAADNLVAVTDDDGSVELFNIYNGMNPATVAEVETVGRPVAVAVGANHVVAACGADGLSIIDAANPITASEVHVVPAESFGTSVGAVAIAGGYAFVAGQGGGGDVIQNPKGTSGANTGNAIGIVELATGQVVGQYGLLNDAAVDLAVSGKVLYAIVGSTESFSPEKGGGFQSYRLMAFWICKGSLEFASTTGLPNSFGDETVSRKVFAGGGLAFATHRTGYTVVDIHNPAAMISLATADTSLFGWKQLVYDGNGLGIAAVSPNSTLDGPHNVSLYDLSDPVVTDQFITEFPTPGIARAVALYNGLAYVADSDAGLQVISYTHFDAGEAPPSVSFTVGDGSGNVELGQTALVAVNATDDIQVRHVELLVNGDVIERDGNFPFEFYFTPVQTVGATASVSVVAIDTSGNRTVAASQEITTVADTTPPRIIGSNPLVDGAYEEVSTITLFTDEAIDGGTLSAAGFTLTGFGSGDSGVPVSITTVELLDRYTIRITPEGSIPYGRNELALAVNAVHDLAGNALAAPYTLSFTYIAPPAPVEWIGADGGDWNNPENWSTGSVPSGQDSVYINPPGDPIVIRNGEFNVQDGSRIELLNVRKLENMRIRLSGNTQFNAPQLTEMSAGEEGGELSLLGGPVTFNAPLVSLVNTRLNVWDGAILEIPTLESFSVTYCLSGAVIGAWNGGSRISLPNLSSVTFDMNLDTSCNHSVSANNGGRIDMPALSGFTLGQSDRSDLIVIGGSSNIDLSALESIQEGVNILANNGQLLLGSLATIDGSLSVGFGWSPEFAAVTQLTGHLEVRASSLSLPALEVIDGAELLAGQGGTMTINGSQTDMSGGTIEAVSGGVINLPAISALHDCSVRLSSSGTINAPQLRTLQAGDTQTSVQVGIAGVLSLPVETVTNVQLQATSGGILELPALTLLEWRERCSGVAILDAHDDGAQLSLPILQTISVDTLGTCTSNTAPLRIDAFNTGTISLPELLTVTLGAGGQGETAYSDGLSLNASGTGSQIDVSKMATFPSGQVTFSATDGGTLLQP